MKIWWKRLLPLMLIAVVALVAACGDDDESSSSAESAAVEASSAAESVATEAESAVESAASEATGAASEAESSAAAPTGGSFKVVSDLPLQGASGAQSKTLAQAIQLYLEQQGGAAGNYAITYESKDDSTAAAAKWDPTTCSSNAQAYAGDESIIGVLGTFNSGCAALEIPILNQANVAMVSPANTGVGLTHVGPGSEPGQPEKFYPTGKRNYTRVVPSDDFQGAAAAQLMQELGVTSVYILNDKEVYGKGVADATAAAAEKLGITVLGNEGYDPKAPNYDALFEQIKGQNPGAIFIGAIIDSNGGQLVKDKVKVLGDNNGVKLVGPDGMLVNDLPTDKQAGAAAEGMYLTFAGLGPDQIKERGGKAAEFLTAYEGEYGKPEVYTVYGAAAMQTMLKAIEASDGTRESVVENLFKVDIPKEESLLGEGYKFDENGDTTLKDMSVFKVTGTDIPFEKAIAVDASLLQAG
jgi:branched-chain amino acid transport system substrate-binding protein